MAKQKPKKSTLRRHEEESLHIIEFSQGKPHELSFNVLEQKASSHEEKKPGFFARLFSRKNKDAASPLGVAGVADPLISGADTSSSVLTAESHLEIQRRQHRRRFRRIVSIAVIVVFCAGALTAGGYYFYKEHERQMGSVELLQRSCDYIEQSDKTLVAIDEFFNRPFDDGTLTTIETLMSQIPEAQEQLVSAREYAQRASEELDNAPTDKEAAEHALNAISARESLLDSARKKLENDRVAKQAVDLMDQAWAWSLEANTLMSEAAKVVSTTTEDNVNTSTRYTTDARTKLVSARDNLDKVATLYPSADLAASRAYLTTCIEATDYALASNAAILVQDRQTAEDNNNKYNATDAAAVEMAKALPASFNQPVVDAYTATTAKLDEDYNRIRNDVGTSDSYLRTYLGTAT